MIGWINRIARGVRAEIDLGTLISIPPRNGITTDTSQCIWRVTKRLTCQDLPHLELTNVDTGDIKVISRRGLDQFYRFRIVGSELAR